MRQNGISVIRTRKHKVTTDSDHKFNIAPNLLDRDFKADATNQKWAGETSYVWAREGWLYLAVILDLHSRRVIGWSFHGHHNVATEPMAWVDGLDIPFSQQMDVGFFEFGAERVTDNATPNYSQGERLWGHPGLRPLSGLQDTVSSPIGACRWEHTDRALTEQLLLEDDGQPATVGLGHAAVRYTNPTTGGDVMPTIRCEFHRLRAGTETPLRQEVGSSVFQVFEGSGAVVLGGETRTLEKGDIFVVPSWVGWSLQAETQFDLFRFSDAPIIERLNFMRTMVDGQ